MQLLYQCPVCKSPRIVPYAMKYTPGFPHISRTKCKDCGIAFANPMASLDELMSFYTNYYDKGNFGALDYKQRVSKKIKEADTIDITELQKRKQAVLQYRNTGSFLDVGFGLGEELALFHRLGFTVYGTEFDQDCINFISNYIPDAGLFRGDLLQARYPDASFDVINVFHVIEHLIDPVAYIKELQRILKPGGVLIIGTPDIGSFAYRVYRLINFATLRVPSIVDGLEHTVVFNKKTLAASIADHGFEITEHYRESLGDSLANILAGNMSFRKKIVRYLQTFVRLNQVLIARKL